MSKNKILVILGPTASGKTALSIKLAKKYNGEIISADSRQIYKGLNIGTGKITKKEMSGIPHHLIDIETPKKKFNVEMWMKMAKSAIEDISKRNKLPIICGGTGFYIDTLVNNISLPNVEPDLKLREKLKETSLDDLSNILKKLDTNRWENIDRYNKVRVIRAIEIAKKIGKVPKLQKNSKKYEYLQIGLLVQSNVLRKKINARLYKRLKTGMIEEVEKLHKKGLSWKRMRELGLEYRYLADYLSGGISEKEMTSTLEKEIWRYAKRQLSWFRRDKSIKWLDPKEFKQISILVTKFLD